jgi:serine/threonine protein kinase
MVTATLPKVWRGRSGREYVPVAGVKVRHGGMASVRKVSGRGGSVGSSNLADGKAMAMKMWLEGDESSLDQLQQEAQVLQALANANGPIPCPRLYDVIGSPLVTGLVMEWCPVDLERWWLDKMNEADAFGRLCAAMAEAARRVSDYHSFFATNKELVAFHGDIKPSNILMAADGRWLISDFGTTTMPMNQSDEWAENRMVVFTENFIAPEVMFGARKAFPASVDTWSLAATFFALLRMKRLVDDGGEIPRSGSQSPRFRMERMNQVIEVFGRDPKRFADRDLEPAAFRDPVKLPEEDRRAVRDALVGVFGPADGDRELQLAAHVCEVLDRTMSIGPAHRYTDARHLAAAFETLMREYIQLSAQLPPATVGPDLQEVVRARDQALRRVRAQGEELTRLTRAVAALEAGLEQEQNLPRHVGPDTRELARQLADLTAAVQQMREGLAGDGGTPGGEVPVWWGLALAASIVLQLLILAAVVVIGAAAVL